MTWSLAGPALERRVSPVRDGSGRRVGEVNGDVLADVDVDRVGRRRYIIDFEADSGAASMGIRRSLHRAGGGKRKLA